MINNRKKHSKALFNSILSSLEKNEFRWDKFFQNWFRIYGSPYFFLFKRNLSVTNTQFAELFALISTNSSYDYKRDDKPNLLYHTTGHIKSTFVETINSLLETYNDGDYQLIEKFSKRYLDIYSNTVAVDMFYGSCSIFLPPGIKMDLENIVHKSGYIHSAGTPIFIRNILKSRKPDFIDALKDHVKEKKYDYKIPLVAYCHEDFSTDDRNSKELLDKGVDQNKIYVEKMSMGRHRLTTVLNELGNRPGLQEKIQLAKPGSFKKNQNFNTDSTIWLIADRAISSNSIKNRGQARYYVCFEQTLKCENPFFIFDENKPAWKSHTTLPHSLTAALLNIAKNSNSHKLCDPFGGTGTTWLELKRTSPHSSIISSDLSPITQQLHQDNLQFFLLSETEIKSILGSLRDANYKKIILEKNPHQVKLELKDNIHPLKLAVDLVNQLISSQPNEEHEYEFSVQFVEDLSKATFEERIYFYLVLKAELRNKGEIVRKRIELSNAFKKECDAFINQLELFLKDFKTDVKIIKERSEFNIVKGKYSIAIVPNFIFYKFEDKKHWAIDEVIKSKNALNLKEDSVDIILCDPPYGFNTIEEDNGLADLYSNFIYAAIKALKINGQLIMCLPAESFTGRDLPYCTNRNVVSRQILNTAHKLGREVFRPAISLPTSELFPPYYWEADKVLSRTILHFHFK